jgi:hypothetical protein
LDVFTGAHAQHARQHGITIVRADFIEVLCDAWQRGGHIDVEQVRRRRSKGCWQPTPAQVAEEHLAYPTRKTFAGLTICITNIPVNPPSIRASFIKRITDNGGEFKSIFSRHCDLLLVGTHSNDQTKSESEKIVRAREWHADAAKTGRPLALRVVWSEWLDDSIAARRVLAFDPYDHSIPRHAIRRGRTFVPLYASAHPERLSQLASASLIVFSTRKR